MKRVRSFGMGLLKPGAWALVTLTLALLMAAGYKIGETFALNHSDTYLEIVSVSPLLDGGTTTDRQPLLRLRFTEPLEPSTVNEYCFSLARDTMRIPTKLAWDEASRTVSLTPRRPLEPGDYHLEVTPNILSTMNHRMMDRFRRDFRVE